MVVPPVCRNADIDGKRGSVVVRRTQPAFNVGTFLASSGSFRRRSGRLQVGEGARLAALAHPRPNHRKTQGEWSAAENNRGLLLTLRKRKIKLYLHGGVGHRGPLISGASLGDVSRTHCPSPRSELTGVAQTVAGAILSRRGMPYDPISVNDTMRVRDVQGTWKLTVDGCVAT